jgi:hypothetical protein
MPAASAKKSQPAARPKGSWRDGPGTMGHLPARAKGNSARPMSAPLSTKEGENVQMADESQRTVPRDSTIGSSSVHHGGGTGVFRHTAGWWPGPSITAKP